MIDRPPKPEKGPILQGDRAFERLPDEKKLEMIAFTVRAINALQSRGFETIGDLRQATESGLSSLGVGFQEMREIRQTMNEYRIEFRREAQE